MSYDKRKHARETFGSILAGIAPTPPTLPKKKRKIQTETESSSEVNLIDIKVMLDRISDQNAELNTKVNEILNRVARIERDRVIDQDFINVLNLFN